VQTGMTGVILLATYIQVIVFTKSE